MFMKRIPKQHSSLFCSGDEFLRAYSVMFEYYQWVTLSDNYSFSLFFIFKAKKNEKFIAWPQI